jgi:hypothetical protein
VDGYTVEDVHQGKLGNCWFVASIATVAEHPGFFEKVTRNKYFDGFFFKVLTRTLKPPRGKTGFNAFWFR